tara:strand:+ start:35 stop:1303 length:1269 start_codon:yes stop_codon:yes gene_type:complete
MKFIFLTLFITSLFSQDQIEGRWHLVGYEDNVMYQFQNNYRYTIYNVDGNFGDLDEAGGTPNPYTIANDIITIDMFFGNVVSYQMVFRCNDQVVDFVSNGIHSTLFREGYDYDDCNDNSQDCFDLSNVDFGECDMALGIGWNGSVCEYFSGCDWVIDDIDYSDFFFNSLDECQGTCSYTNECDQGYIELNGLCFYENDVNVIQKMIDSSYESNIDLGCEDWDLYCGSPNPYMDSSENWGWIAYDGITYEMPGNENGFVEPLELGIQEWENGRLTSLMCGAYIYCQLSGPIPEEINTLTELEVFRVEGNYFNGFIPESICEFDLSYNDYLAFDVGYNYLCPPYPDCIDTNDQFWGQFDEECNEIGDINGDSRMDILDVILLVPIILDSQNIDYQIFVLSDINYDDSLNVNDIIVLVNIILNSQ